jgi:hypothetical protein
MSISNYVSKPVRALRKAVNLPKNAYYRNRNSIPYISGDAFADSADFQAFPPKFRKIGNQCTDISEARVIFCPGHLIEKFLEDYGSKVSARILILGNSDREFYDLDFRFPKSIKHVFAQNMYHPNSSFATAIPIGIENLRLNMNGHTNLFGHSVQEADSKILIGPFGMTHPEREELQILRNNGHPRVSYIHTRISPSNYSKLAQSHSFIAAPRGNGVDTHRLWETLYRGAIPLVRDSAWLENFEFLASMTLKVSSWNLGEILTTVENRKVKFFNPQAVPELWWPYWQDLINSKFK